ncbi:MAG: hypothetical protein HYV94_08510, partial [Candidatus Rokubacteria bacterium]|nr:hypothetical protein [Candidatus Rokubacteria bacterium]
MEAPMIRRALVTLAVLALAPSVAAAAPASREPRLHPGDVSMLPSFVRRVEPSVVGLRVRASEHGASAARLGTRRFGSGLVFDARGYAVTVSYLLLDAVAIEARGRDGRAV